MDCHLYDKAMAACLWLKRHENFQKPSQVLEQSMAHLHFKSVTFWVSISKPRIMLLLKLKRLLVLGLPVYDILECNIALKCLLSAVAIRLSVVDGKICHAFLFFILKCLLLKSHVFLLSKIKGHVRRLWEKMNSPFIYQHRHSYKSLNRNFLWKFSISTYF